MVNPNATLEDMMMEYKKLQHQLNELFEPVLKNQCVKCDVCCHETPMDSDGTTSDVKILALYNIFPKLEFEKENRCAFWGDDGCGNDIKPQKCIRHICSHIGKILIKNNQVEVFNKLLRELKKLHDRLLREL